MEEDTQAALAHAILRYKNRESVRKSLGIPVTPSPTSVLRRGDDDALRYGLDQELYESVRRKQDFQIEWKVCDWVESLLRVAVDDFYTSARDGALLCRVANSVRPENVPPIRFHEKNVTMLEMENIRMYLSFCRSIGMADWELFEVKDLYACANLPAVVTSVLSLERRVRGREKEEREREKQKKEERVIGTETRMRGKGGREKMEGEPLLREEREREENSEGCCVTCVIC